MTGTVGTKKINRQRESLSKQIQIQPKMLANKSASAVLRLAAQEGRIDVVQYLIERGVIKDDADEKRRTALYLAAR